MYYSHGITVAKLGECRVNQKLWLSISLQKYWGRLPAMT